MVFIAIVFRISGMVLCPRYGCVFLARCYKLRAR